MTEHEKKEFQEIMKQTADEAAREAALGYRFMYSENETRFHFVYATLIVLGVVVGFLLAHVLI